MQKPNANIQPDLFLALFLLYSINAPPNVNIDIIATPITNHNSL